jgi:hypothetical protein
MPIGLCGSRHVDPGHRGRYLDVLAHLGVEGLSFFGDHAWRRVNFMSLVGGDKVDRVAWLDPDKIGRKYKEASQRTVE